MTVYFIDLDKEALDRIAAEGNAIFFFSCWAFDQKDLNFLAQTFPYTAGIIRKPLADKYVYIDDKLDVALCATNL